MQYTRILTASQGGTAMQLYLTVRPEDTRTASAYPAGLAHAAYRIGEGSSLLSRNLLTPARPADGPVAGAAGSQ